MFLYTRTRVGLRRQRISGVVSLVAVLATVAFGYGLLRPVPAIAAPANTINFQARLETASGAIATDGTYNVQFKLYSASSGGTALWTEDYLVNASQGIRTANGYLTANLGGITAFPSSINWGQQLYLTMNIGGTGTTASYDGEMSPRLALTSVPSAFALNSYNSANGYSSSLTINQPTGGTQNFVIPDQGIAGTFTLLTTSNAINGFIQNTTSLQAGAANFNISGSGTAATSFLTPLLDTPSGTTVLNVGTNNATGGINLNQNVTLAAGKSLTFASGAGNFDQSLSTGSFKTGTGAVSINGDATVASGKNVLVTSGNLTLSSGNIGLTSGNVTVTAGNLIVSNGSSSFASANTGTGTVSSSTAAAASVTNTSSGTITTATGLSVAVTKGSGSITTGYNLNLANISNQAANSYSIYSQGGANLLMTGAANVVGLTVQAAASQSADLLRLTSSLATLSGFNSAGQLFQLSNGYRVTLDTTSNNQPNAITLKVPALPSGTTSDTFCLVSQQNCTGGASGAVTTVGALDGGVLNANGASININNIYLQSASTSYAGLVNINSQTFGGDKTFANALTVTGATGVSTLQASGLVTANANLVVKASSDSGTVISLKDNSNATALEIRTGTANDNNTFIGVGTGSSITTGAGATDARYNVGLGYNSLQGVTTGNSNIAIGYVALQTASSGGRNVAIGDSALQKYLNNDAVAIGYNALQKATGGAGSNGSTAIGSSALSVSTSGINVAVGNSALSALTSGNSNTIIGTSGGGSLTTAGNNTGVGDNVLNKTIGANNTAVGASALAGGSSAANNTGANNSAFGFQTLNGITAGAFNTGVGSQTLTGLSDGSFNVALGGNAGNAATTGSSNNVFLGYQAGGGTSGSTTGSGNTFIGYQAGKSETGSNKLYIANSATSSALIQGDFSANTLTTNGSQSIINKTAANINLLLKGATSQSADMLQFQNVNGAVLGGVTNGGALYTTSGGASLGGLVAPTISLTTGNNGTAYYYAVASVNGASAITTVGNVIGTDANNATISWSQVTGATAYKVYRSTTNNFAVGTTVKLLSTISDGSTSYTDTAVSGSNSVLAAPTGTGLSVQTWAGQTGTPFKITSATGSSLASIDTAGTATLAGNLNVAGFGSITGFLAVGGSGGFGGSITSNTNLTVGTNGSTGTFTGQVILAAGNANNGFVILQPSSSQAVTTTLNIPVDGNATDTICLLTIANCSGTLAGSGTTNYVARFTSSTALGNGLLYDTGMFGGYNITSQLNNSSFGIQAASGTIGLTVKGSGSDIANFLTGGGTTAASINSAGLLTASAGLTTLGTTSLNSTGTAATTIGNSGAALSIAGTGAAAATNVVALRVASDTYDRLQIRADGQLNFGTGSVATDTTLYRSASGTLKTDGYFTANGGINVGNISAAGKLSVQSGTTTTTTQVNRALASQTADLLQLQDSTGAILQNSDASGNFYTAGNLTNPYGGIGTYGNFLFYSEAFDQISTWGNTNVTTPTANTVIDPLGTTTAESLVDTASGGYVTQTSNVAPTNANYTFSVWLKTASGTQNVDLRVDGATSGSGTVKTVTATTTWQRFFVTQNTNGFGGNINVKIFPGTTSASGTVQAWGAQLQLSSTPGVYTSTTTTGTGQANGLFTKGIFINGAATLYAGATVSNGALNVTNSAGINLGSASASTGKIVFYGTGGNGTLTLQGPTTPNTGNYTLNLPTLTANDTVCTIATCGTGGLGSYINNSGSQQTNANINIQSAASAVALVVQGASGQNIANFAASGSTTPVASFDQSGNLTANGTTLNSSSLTFTNSGTATVQSASGQNLNLNAQGSANLNLATNGSNRIVITANGAVGIGVASPSARLQVGGASSGTAGTAGFALRVDGATITDGSTAANGTATNNVVSGFAQATVASTNTNVTTTNAANVYIQGATKAGTNQLLTNSYGLQIDSASVAGGNGVQNAYGLSVQAPTGATNNYAAIFQGGNVGIGTSSPANKLTVNASTTSDATAAVQINTGADTNKALVLQGNSATQSANIFEVQNSAGAARFSVTNSGTVFAFNGYYASNGLFFSTDQTATNTNSASATFRSGNASGATSNTGSVNLQSGASTTSGNTGDVNIVSGAATSGNSGNINLDVGTASGTKGTISVGTANASSITIGPSSAINITSGGTVTFGGGANLASGTNSALSKNYITGTGGVTQYDVVVLGNDSGNNRVLDTTTARDPRVVGVAGATSVSGSAVSVAYVGTILVNVDTAAVAIGDQLVTSTTSGRATVDNNATTGIVGVATTTKAAGSNGTVTVSLGVHRGQTNPNFVGNATVGGSLSVGGQSVFSTAGKLQNAAFDATVNYSNLQNVTSLSVGVAGTTAGTLKFTNATNTNVITLQSAVQSSGSYTLFVPNLSANDTICTVNTCGTGGLGSYINNGGASNAQQSNANFNILANSGTISTIQGASGVDVLDLNQNGGSNAFKVDSTGNVTAAGNITANSGLTFTAASAATVQSASGQNLNINAQGTGNLKLQVGGYDVITLNQYNAVGIATAPTNARLTIAASTNIGGAYYGAALRVAAATTNDSSTAASGTNSAVANNAFLQNTYSATNTNVTTTAAANIYIQGATKAGTNQTITNSYGLQIDSASVAGGNGVQNAYGLSVAAPTGATNNYAAIFQGGNVGIGTTAPAALLSVGSTSQFQVSSAGAVTAASVTSTGDLTAASSTAGFYVSSSTATVGIGTGAISGAKLYVATSSVALRLNVASGTNDIAQYQFAGSTLAKIDYTGALTAVGVNSGGGLIQGSGGLTVAGTTQINATGPAATTIGSSSAGAIGITSGNAITVTAGAASTVSTTAGLLTLQGAGGISLASAAGSTSSDITLKTGNASAGAAGNISLDTGTFTSGTPTISLGTTNAAALTLGRTGVTTTIQGNTAVTLNATTGTNSVCRNAAGLLSACDATYLAPTASNFIQNNASATAQTGNFNITGNGIANTLTAGATLSVGSTTAPSGGAAYINGNVGIGTSSIVGQLQVESATYRSNQLLLNNGVTGTPPAYPNGYLPSLSVISSQASSSRPLFFGYSNAGSYSAFLTSGACGSFSQMCLDLGSGTTAYTALENIGNVLKVGGGDDGNFSYVNLQGNVGVGNSNSPSLFSVGSSSQFQVSSAGAVTAAGVNSGSGLLQGSGGLTVTGTTNINNSGTGTTNIGSSSAGAVAILSGGAISVTAGAASTISTSAGQLTLSSGSGTLGISSTTTTLQRTAASDFTIDLNDSGNRTLTLKNSGAGVANLNLYGGSLQTGATPVTRIDNSGNFFSSTETVSPTTDAANVFQVQNAADANMISVSTNATNYVANSGAESTTFTAWTQYGTATITRDTLNYAAGSASAKAATAAINSGVKNTLTSTLTNGQTYLASFSAKTGTSGDVLSAVYLYNGSAVDTGATTCTTGQTISNTAFQKFNCYFTIGSTPTAANAFAIYNATTGKTIYVDNLSITQQTVNTLTVNQVQLGGAAGQGLTLLTLDTAAAAPTTASNTTALLGSIYYDTTAGAIQCYGSNGWGACGVSPNIGVNLIPEYSGAVLDGTKWGSNKIGTMTSGLCSGTSRLSVNTSLCGATDDYNFYNWTSPQATGQTYSIFVRYQLPATFKSFTSTSYPSLSGYSTSVATNASGSLQTNGVQFAMFNAAGSQCGSSSATQVTSSANSWQTASINPTAGGGSCTAASFNPGDVITFRIDMTANNNNNAYASNLSFLTIGK